VLERTFKPRFDYLFGVVGDLLVLPPTDHRVRLAAFSIHGLIVTFRQHPVTKRVNAQLQISFSAEQITEHLLAFCLAGIEAYRPWRKAGSLKSGGRRR
jgi:hypothetical protein